jgi:hypothetical protein
VATWIIAAFCGRSLLHQQCHVQGPSEQKPFLCGFATLEGDEALCKPKDPGANHLVRPGIPL